LIKDIIKKDKKYICYYGNPQGRIEKYSIDTESLFGYDSSGTFTMIALEDLDTNDIQEIQECVTIFKKHKKEYT